MVFLQLLPLFCALLFTLTRKINVKVTKSDELTVKINFNIFAILLTEEKIKKRGFGKLSRLIRSYRSVLKPTDYLLSKSEIRIYQWPESSFADKIFPALYSLSFFASAHLIYSYLEKNARSIRFMDPSPQNKDTATTFFAFSVHFSLWNLIIFTLVFLYYIVKNKIKRVFKNV